MDTRGREQTFEGKAEWWPVSDMTEKSSKVKTGKCSVDLATDITRILNKGRFTEVKLQKKKSQWLKKITGWDSGRPRNVATNGMKKM